MATPLFIPQDIVQDILTKLPVKTLLRLKCLSKNYCTLIESPTFISSHLSHSIKNPSLLVFLGDNNFELSPRSSFHSHETITNYSFTPLTFSYHYVNVIGSCHGLLCCQYLDDETDDFELVTVLWNPATRKFKRLPKHDPEERCDQLAIGLGFDPKGNDYKLVRASVFGRYPRASILCEVIERNKGVWRRITHDNPDYVPPPGGLWQIPKTASAAVQGALYWNIDGEILLSFSLLDDTFQWIPFPPPLNNYSMTGYNSRYRLETCCAWKESVAAVANLPNFRSKDQCFDIWVLNGSDKERAWSKLFTVTASVSERLIPICLWRDREVVFKQSNEDGKKLVWLGIYGETGLSKDWEEDVYVHAWWNYEESLVEL